MHELTRAITHLRNEDRERILVIAPCGSRKIWGANFLAGPTPAKNACLSTVFKLHRKYAEKFVTDWRILSAWYGITHPDQLIEDYEARFKQSDLEPQSSRRLQAMFRQARMLPPFDRVLLLGGSLYRRIAHKLLIGRFLRDQIVEPFAGLDLFETNRALKRALLEAEPIANGKSE